MYHHLKKNISADPLAKRQKKHKKYISLEEVSLHNEKNDIWMVIHDKVYDVSNFLQRHPGGVEVMLDCAGVDATSYFEDVGHSEYSKQLLKPLLIGELSLGDRKSTPTDITSFSNEQDLESSEDEIDLANKMSSDRLPNEPNNGNFMHLARILLVFLLCLVDSIKFIAYKPKRFLQRCISQAAYPKLKKRGGQDLSLFLIYCNLAFERVPYIVLFIIAIVAALFYVYIQKIKLN